jgi:hypothetical protein
MQNRNDRAFSEVRPMSYGINRAVTSHGAHFQIDKGPARKAALANKLVETRVRHPY